MTERINRHRLIPNRFETTGGPATWQRAPGPPEVVGSTMADRARAAGVARPWGLFLLGLLDVAPLSGSARQAFICFRRPQTGRLKRFDMSILRQIAHGARLVEIMTCTLHDMPPCTSLL